MLFMIAVTQNALVAATGATVTPEKVLVAPEAVTARDPQAAILALGAAHAADLKDADPQLIAVHIRQGV